MDHFRRSVIRILVVTLFLLFIAWLCLKLMQYGGDMERLLQDGQRWIEGWGQSLGVILEKLRPLAQPAIDALGPRVEEAVGKARGIIESKG